MGTAGGEWWLCSCALKWTFFLPSFPQAVSPGPGRGAPLQPFALPGPFPRTFRAFGGSGIPNVCRAAAHFSPGHAAARPGLWRHRSGCGLTLSSLRERGRGRAPHLLLACPGSPPGSRLFSPGYSLPYPPGEGAVVGRAAQPLPSPEGNPQLGHTPGLHQPSKCRCAQARRPTHARTHTRGLRGECDLVLSPE